MLMCDIMPTISEDGDMNCEGNVDDNNFEQLMINMLDERDKLLETLRETQENLSFTKTQLKEVGLERNALVQQFDNVIAETNINKEQLIKSLSSYDSLKRRGDPDVESTTDRLKNAKWTLAEEFVTMAKQLHQFKDRIAEKDEEIMELKAERCNTKLLLEHLECLVSRHERSLRMTVVKRQAQASAGVSSEVEVLKALKSLFEHHKALDEKVREKLRIAVEKCNDLEKDLVTSHQESARLEEECKALKESRLNGKIPIMTDDSFSTKVPNGPLSQLGNDSALQSKVKDLQVMLDKKINEADKFKRESKELSDRMRSMEEQVTISGQQLTASYDGSQRLQRDLEEACAQKHDMEERIITLEKRYVRSQNDLSAAHEDSERLRMEVEAIQNSLKQKNDKLCNLQEQLTYSEQKVKQSKEEMESLPKIQEELADRQAALNEAEERNFTAEERLQQLQMQLEEISSELANTRQREKMSQEHNIRLQATIDKLLNESDHSLQQHVKEKMATSEEKALIAHQLDSTKATVVALQRDKLTLFNDLEKVKAELDGVRSEMRHSRDLTALLMRSRENLFSSIEKSSDSPQGSRDDVTMSSTEIKIDTSAVSQTHVIETRSNLTPAAQLSNRNSPSNRQRLTPSPSSLSATSSTSGTVPGPLPKIIAEEALESLSSGDAHHLANMLQSQLDAINNELALLQVEHRSTEQRAVEIERKVGSETSSLDELSVGSASAMPDMSTGLEDTKGGMKANNDPYLQPPRRHAGGVHKSLDVEDGVYLNKTSAEPTDTNSAFPFTSYDPLDTKPLMLKRGRSEEALTGSTPPETPSSFPSDSTDSSGLSVSRTAPIAAWSMQSSFDADADRMNFEYASNPNSLASSMESLSKRGSKRGLRSSIGKIFSKGKLKKDMAGGDRSGEQDADAEMQKQVEHRMKAKMLEDVVRSGAPFASWNAPTILAWLELWLKLPEWYIAACRANVKSGSIMSALSDTEIQHEIGVNNPMHRLKLRLAINEMVHITNPMAPSSAKRSLLYGDLSHHWIANQWLPSLGLPQYRNAFLESLVDARMLAHTTKKEFQKYLKVVDSFHRNSIECGVKCLEMLAYDRHALERRRKDCEDVDQDVLVWSNDRVIKWVSQIGLEDFADYLKESGLHGAVIATDESFNIGSLTYHLQIPATHVQARQILDKAFKKLVKLCPDRTLNVEFGEGDFKRNKSWRKKFKKEKPKERAKEIRHELVRRNSGESDGSQQSGSSGSDPVSSPAHRLGRSPALEKKEGRLAQR